MSNIEEINNALNNCIFRRFQKRYINITLHPEYQPFLDVNLKAMNSIKNKFKVDIGYSDHTLGVDVIRCCIRAKIIEKHITLNRNLSGPDHKASLELKEFRNLVKG